MPIDGLARHKSALITCLLLGMLAGGGHLPSRVEGAVFYVVVFGVALLASPRGRWFDLFLTGSTVLYGLAWLNAFHDMGYNVLFSVAGLVCLGHGITSTILSVLRSKRVNVGEVFALVNCYLLMGFSWALLYSLLQSLDPEAFALRAGGERIADSFIYFSFTTMTTVGYGDTVPHSVLAQRLSVIQAVLGQFYFALVVAWLLNRLFQQRMKDAEPGGGC